MPVGDYRRLMEWVLHADRKHGCNLPFFLVDVAQTVNFAKDAGMCSLVPSLLTGSKIVICCPDYTWRMAVPEELLAAHGFPMFAEVAASSETMKSIGRAVDDSSPVAKTMRSMLEDATLSHMRSIRLIGNSMCYPSVGNVFLYAIACMQRTM